MNTIEKIYTNYDGLLEEFSEVSRETSPKISNFLMFHTA